MSLSRAPRLLACSIVTASVGWVAAGVIGAEVAPGTVTPLDSTATAGSAARIVELDYRAPSECPTHDVVVERVRQMVRRAPSTPLAAKATIERAKQYTLLLELEGGQRYVASESCKSLAETLTVILALAIDPNAQVTTPPSPTVSSDPSAPPSSSPAKPANSASPPSGASSANAPSASSNAAAANSAAPTASASNAAAANSAAPAASASAESEREPPSDESVEVPPPRAPSSSGDVAATDKPTEEADGFANRWSFAPTALFQGEYGMLPSVGYGPRVGLWIDHGRWSIVAGAEWLVPEWVQMPSEVRRGGHISYLGGQGQLCYAPSRRVRLHGCLGLQAGDLLGKGDGVRAERLGHGLWLAGVSSVAYRPRLWSKLSLDLRLDFAFSVIRPQFGFTGDPWTFDPKTWSLRLAGGFSWAL